MKTVLFAAICLIVNTYAACAGVVWSEDFSNVSDWKIGYDPGAGSTLTSDGNVGLLYVNAGASEAAFVPDSAVKPFAPFDPIQKAQYTLSLTVASITSSTSYDVALDQFDSSFNFLGTTWNVFPSSGTSVATGLQNVNLGTLSFDSNTAYLMPKINVHTGNGAQTVGIDDLSISTAAVPEASTSTMFGIAAVMGTVLVLRNRRSLEQTSEVTSRG